MAVMQSGQVVLFRFPQTDLSVGKLRPALLISPLPGDYKDWLACMISTKTGQSIVGLDEIMNSHDTDFNQSGLKSESIIRVSRIAVVNENIFSGTIGHISLERIERIKQNLAKWILE